MRCNAYDNTKSHLLSYRIKLDNKEFFPGLVERNGEILLSKSNVQDIKYITRRFQEHAYKKYGLPMSEKMFNIYEARKPLNKGYTALSIRKGTFTLLEQYIDNYNSSSTKDYKETKDIELFKQDINQQEQINKELTDLYNEVNQVNNYSPEITSSSIPSVSNEEVNNYKNAYVEYFNYKNTILNQTKRYLYETNVEINKTKDPIKKAELIQVQQELKEAIYGNEVKGIIGLANQMSDVTKDNKKYKDLLDVRARLERSLELLQEAGQDTTQVLSQLQDNSLSLYELKNENLSTLFRSNSLQDLDRAGKLIDTGKLSNLVKAKEIINFYKSVDPSNQDLTNPYYSKEELLSGRISQDIIDDLHDISNRAYDLENRINNTSRKSILDYINSLDTFLKKNNNELYSEEDIFRDKEGLLDITILDQVIYNIQDNPFSKVDSILQAAIFKRVKDSISQEESAIKDITDELDDRNPKVVRELLRLGHKLSNNSTLAGIRHRVLGRLDNTPDFSIFKQISNEGVLKNKLVQRESDKYKSKVKAIKAQYNKDISALLNGTNTNKTSEDINNLYFNKLREISEIVKPHLMPEIVNTPEYRDLLDANTTVDINDDYKNSIINKIGEQGYNDILDKQKKQLDSYIVAKQQKQDSLIYMYAVENDIEDPSSLTLADLDETKQNNLVDWIVDHSPFYNGLLFDENRKVQTRERRYNNYELDYSQFIPRNKEAKIVYQRSYADNISKNFRLVSAVETNTDTNFLDERYKYIEDNPVLYDFWKTSMKASEYYQQSLSPDEKQNWEDGDLPIDDKVDIERFIASSDSIKDKILTYINRSYRNILKNIYSQLSSTMDVPYSSYDYTDKRLNVNTSSINVGTRSINNEIRLRQIELKKLLKDNGFQYRDDISVENVPPQFLREALFLYGTNNTRLSQMNDAELRREYISSFNIEPNRRNVYSTNILNVLKDLHTQNALKQTNGDLGLTLLKSASLASGIIARKKNVDMIQFMVDAFNNIKLTDANSFSTPKINNKTGSTVILASLRKRAVSQMSTFIKNQFELRGSGNDNNIIANKEKAENLEHGFFNNYVLDNQKDLDLIDELLEDPNITPKEQEDLLRIKLQKIRYFDGVKGVLRPISTQLRLVSLGYKTISNLTNLYEGTKQILIHDATGQDWIPGKGTEALAIMKGAFVRNLTQFNKKLDKTITPQASKARFIIDRLDFIEDASTLEAKALKKQTTTGLVKDIVSGLSPYVLIKKIEYVNQGSVALAMLMSQDITDNDGNVSNVWDALDNKGQLKSEFRNENNINTWEKFNTQEALDFKSKLNNARNKTSGDYSQLGESELNASHAGKLILNFKKWMPKYLAQMYGNYRYDYDSGKNIKGRAKSLHPLELVMHRVSSSLALKGFGVHALFLAPMIAADFYSYAHDLDPNKPQLENMTSRLGLMAKVALKTIAGFPINLVASGIYKNKPIINISNDKIFGKSLENKLLNQGIKPEDIGNIKAMGVELGMNIINIVGIMLVYGTMLSGDKDDEETPTTLGYTKNEWGTIVQNTLMPLLKQGEAFYADPLNAFTSINNIPIMTYLEQLDKSATTLNRVINGLDTDYIAKGRDAGKYKSDKIIKKVIPVPMRDMDSKKYMRFEEYIPGQLIQDGEATLDKNIGNIRSEIKNNFKNEITKDNIEGFYNKYEIEYVSEDKEGVEIPYLEMKNKLLEKIMKNNIPKPSKGDKKEAYKALQEVRDGNLDYQEYLKTYVLSKEEKEELKEE